MSKHFQQSDFWCDFKCAHGWKKYTLDNINILVRTFKKGPVNLSLAYVPMAPEFECESTVPGFEDMAMNEVNYIKKIGEFSQKAKSILPENTMCIRYDLPLDMPSVEIRDDYNLREGEVASYAKVKLIKAPVDIQPPDSTYLDLSKTSDELLASMKSKGRYNIRYAAKHGVTVRAVTADSPDFEKDLDSFYELYKTTSARDGIGIHPKSYYKDLLERGASAADTKITLYIASHEGDDLAAIITLFQQDEAIYLYGCSGNVKRNLMPAYLVQWTAIQDARNFGSKIYDFYGIPPTGDEGHPMHGLYLFKTMFGGPEVHRPGSFDIKLSNVYLLYRFVEKLRAFWHKKVLKWIRGR